MPGMVQARATQVLDALLRAVALPASTLPIKTKFMATTGTATAGGTEIAGGDYPAGGISTTFGAAATASISNSAAVTQTNMPATTVNGIDLTDSTATPVRQFYGALSTAKTTNAGDTLTFDTAAIVASITST